MTFSMESVVFETWGEFIHTGFSFGIDTVDGFSEDINTELVLHAELLDDLETGIDNTELHIRDGTRRADKIMQKNKSWAGTCTIFVLLAIIVV